MIDVDVVAWDFDGVINVNIIEGEFIWSRNLKNDTGVSLEFLQKQVFTETFGKVIRGEIDLIEHIAPFVDESPFRGTANDFLGYWFEKDNLPDSNVISIIRHIEKLGIKQLIATNNEQRRANYIRNNLSVIGCIDRVFSSGEMGMAKPERAFFEEISRTISVIPSRILLIDDNLDNVNSANKLGWKSFYFKNFDYQGLCEALDIDEAVMRGAFDVLQNP